MYTYDYMDKNTESTNIALGSHVEKNTQPYLIYIDFIIIEA